MKDSGTIVQLEATLRPFLEEKFIVSNLDVAAAILDPGQKRRLSAFGCPPEMITNAKELLESLMTRFGDAPADHGSGFWQPLCEKEAPGQLVSLVQPRNGHVRRRK